MFECEAIIKVKMRSWFLIFPLVCVLSKNILLSSIHYMHSHWAPFVSLAERIGQESEFNCFIVAEPETRINWNSINCTVLFIPENKNIGMIKELQEKIIGGGENGNIIDYDNLKEMLSSASVPYWNQAKITEQLKEIGIDMAICDTFNIACSLSIHALNISKSVYLHTSCFPWVFFELHKMGANYIPYGSIVNLYGELSFFERIYNHFRAVVISYLGFQMSERIAAEHIPNISENDWRSNTLHRRESLFILPCVPSFTYPEYLPPNLLHSGPLINRVQNDLPENILEFIRQYKNVVYISFGTISVTYNFKEVLVVAKQFIDTAFIINYAKKERIDNIEIPKNCLILTWAPQFDILASGKVNCFITHAGWNSISEALYNGVPMITCGWTIDREGSALIVHERKVGISILKNADFKAKNIIAAIKGIFEDSSYKENAMKYSKMLKHLDSEGKIIEALKLYFEVGIENMGVENEYPIQWFQIQNLDIYCFLIAVVLLIIFIFIKIVEFIWIKIFRTTTKLDENKKKKD